MTAQRPQLSGPTLLAGGVVLSVAVASFMRAPLLPEIGRDLRLTAADLAMITTAFACGRLVMDLPAGRLADRLPPGPALAGTGVGVALSAGLLAGAGSFAHALIAVFFLGAASALTNTTGMTVFATSAPPERRGVAMAGFSMALMTGQTLGPAVGGLIAGVVELACRPGRGRADRRRRHRRLPGPAGRARAAARPRAARERRAGAAGLAGVRAGGRAVRRLLHARARCRRPCCR